MMDKIRPNVVVLGLFISVLTGLLAVKLIDLIIAGSDVPAGVTEILALLVGVGLGGLVSTMGQTASDPPPPTVPAGVHQYLMERAMPEVVIDTDVKSDS